MAITAHFADNDGRMRQMLLSMDAVEDGTAPVIKRTIREALHRFDIDEKMIFRLISDAASANISAFKDNMQCMTTVRVLTLRLF